MRRGSKRTKRFTQTEGPRPPNGSQCFMDQNQFFLSEAVLIRMVKDERLKAQFFRLRFGE